MAHLTCQERACVASVRLRWQPHLSKRKLNQERPGELSGAVGFDYPERSRPPTALIAKAKLDRVPHATMGWVGGEKRMRSCRRRTPFRGGDARVGLGLIILVFMPIAASSSITSQLPKINCTSSLPRVFDIHITNRLPSSAMTAVGRVYTGNHASLNL
jgi:hypothetical protein